MTATTETPTGSFTAGLVVALDAAWSAIQAQHPQVPDVIVTVGSGTLWHSAGETRLGHFAANRWQRGPDGPRVPELFIGGEGLAAGAERVLTTLLHEAAHGLADARGVKDTSRQGRYHNTRYRDVARELGLVCEDAGLRAHGWTATRLPPSTAEHYARVLRELEAVLVAWRHPEPAARPGESARKNGVVARCGCERQFRITARVLEAGPITCGVCGMRFQNTTGEEQQQRP